MYITLLVQRCSITILFLAFITMTSPMARTLHYCCLKHVSVSIQIVLVYANYVHFTLSTCPV